MIFSMVENHSNPADIYQFQIHTGKKYTYNLTLLSNKKKTLFYRYKKKFANPDVAKEKQ